MLIEEELGATPGQSNLTLVCPHDANGVYPILNLVEFETKIRDIYLDCRSKGEGIRWFHYMKYRMHISALCSNNLLIQVSVTNTCSSLF